MRLLALPVITLTLLLSGCGQDSQEPIDQNKEMTRLTVTKPDGSKTNIVCPSADERCAKLTPEALKPIPADSICGQVYGGPEKARIVGELNGQTIDLSLSRTDSCRIAQWDSLSWLVGPGSTPNAQGQSNSPEINKPAGPRPDISTTPR